MSERLERIKKLCKNLIFIDDNLDYSRIDQVEKIISDSINSQAETIEKSNYLVTSTVGNDRLQKFYTESPASAIYNDLCLIDHREPKLKDISIYSIKEPMKPLLKISNNIITIIHYLAVMRDICHNDEGLQDAEESISRLFVALSDIIERALKEMD